MSEATAETEKDNLERSEKEYANRWHDYIREKIDNASGDELQRVSMELRRNVENVEMRKTLMESARESRQRRQATPLSEKPL